MTFYVEDETGISWDFPVQELAELVADRALEQEGCPYAVQINLLITDGEGIRAFNEEYRGIDRETDVLSFPGIDFEAPGAFDSLKLSGREADYFDPDSKELILGDIILFGERVLTQAAEYGHSVRREFAFLLAHSMLHLCGYDHMEPGEAAVMEARQERVLTSLGITREA